jgi:hypothetical protein
MLVASKAFLDGCELSLHTRAISLGLRTLRGIAAPMELFAIEPRRVDKAEQCGEGKDVGDAGALTIVSEPAARIWLQSA